MLLGLFVLKKTEVVLIMVKIYVYMFKIYLSIASNLRLTGH